MSSFSHTALAFPPQPKPDPISHNSLLTVITSSTALTHLKQVHAQILRSKPERSNSLLLKIVLSSCALSSGLDYALSVFCQIQKPETHFCNKVLREFSRGMKPEKTLLVYEKMRRDGSSLDRFSFPPLLKAVSKVSAFIEGLEIHGLAAKLGFDSDPFIQTGLIGMYAACGRILEARLLFDKMSHRDVVTWNIMIDGYCKIGLFDHVLKLYEEMKNSDMEPDGIILCTVLSACGRAGNLSYGKAVHEFIKDNGIVVDSHLQSALVNMYANCGAMDLAQQLYDQASSKHLVVSTAMVSGLIMQLHPHILSLVAGATACIETW
ncbi:hypothetical protein L6164_012749 [Bauhinia variegata]|uniref:Uncharacterized protein n=1 Tax=Bauhinia variegata TaxID=167791 RepID=A0ACB9PCK5_BAUVA|nr:hypothetical protein L6164_012749 [Bauhinia variegata]